MPGAASDAINRLLRRLAKLDGERAEVVRAIEALKPAAEAEGLTVANQSDNTSGMMPSFERLKHSKQATTTGKRTQKLRAACNAADLSIRDLAELARKETRFSKCSQASLSMAANDLRPMDGELARWIAGKIAYPATVANWPKLRRE